jgi:hypothetical protein
MTTIQEQLSTLLQPLAAGGAAPSVQIENNTYPYIVYRRLVSPAHNTLSGNGNPVIYQTLFEISSWGYSYSDAVNTAAAVTAAMQGWTISGVPVQNILQHETDLYEPDVKLFRVVQEFSVWHYN